MKPSTNLWRITLTIVVGILAIYIEVYDSDHRTPFDDIRQKYFIVLGSGSIIILFWTLYKDIKTFLRTKKTASFISTLVYISLLVVYILTPAVLLQRDKSPIALSAGYTLYSQEKWIIDSYSLDLRANKTYKLKIHEFFSDDYYRGSFSMTDSIIEFDHSIMDSVILSNKFVIRFNKRDSLNKTDLYQIDDKGNTIEKAPIFTVNNVNLNALK